MLNFSTPLPAAAPSLGLACSVSSSSPPRKVFSGAKLGWKFRDGSGIYEKTHRFYGGFQLGKWGYPKLAGWFISWKTPESKIWMMTGGSPMT